MLNDSLLSTSDGRLDLTDCSLPDFAAAVIAALQTVGATDPGRFSARKVFMSAVYRQLARSGHDVGSLDSFKARLVLAQRAGYLMLARADMVAAMSSATVAASEIVTNGATLHFVIDPSGRDPWETVS